MFKLRPFKTDEAAGVIAFAIPITAAVFFVSILFSLPVLGFQIHPFFLQPIFALWVIFVGILFSVCFFMRQFLILFIGSIISFLALVYIYIMYVIQ